MKKLQNLLLLAALLAFGATAVSCSEDDEPNQTTQNNENDNPNPNPNPDPNPDPTPDPEVPGEYPAIGEANAQMKAYGVDDENNPTVGYLYFALSSATLEDLQFDNQGNATSAKGTGVSIEFIFGIPFPEGGTVVGIPEGTYNFDDVNGGANSVVSGYYTAVKNDDILVDALWVDGSNVKISAAGDGSYKLDFNLVLDNGKTVKDSCVVAISGGQQEDYSTLTGDITLNKMVVGQVLYLGPWDETTPRADAYILVLNDGVNDGVYYTGDMIQLMMNVSPNSPNAIPNGKYNSWIDLMRDPEASLDVLKPYSIMAGMIDEEGIDFSWYVNDTSEQNARLQGGEVNVNVDAAGKYTITGAVEDYQGYKINFSYEGTPHYEDLSQESTSGVKSIKAIKGMKPMMPMTPMTVAPQSMTSLKSAKSVKLGEPAIVRRSF